MFAVNSSIVWSFNSFAYWLKYTACDMFLRKPLRVWLPPPEVAENKSWRLGYRCRKSEISLFSRKGRKNFVGLNSCFRFEMLIGMRASVIFAMKARPFSRLQKCVSKISLIVCFRTSGSSWLNVWPNLFLRNIDAQLPKNSPLVLCAFSEKKNWEKNNQN